MNSIEECQESFDHRLQKVRDEVVSALPASAFQRDPKKLAWMGLHLFVVGLCYWLAGKSESIANWMVCGFLAAQSQVCIGFLAHDLAHGSILRRGALRNFFETVSWGVNLISATLWRRVHNRAHHSEYNTPGDPDRLFLVSEERWGNRWFLRLFVPNRETFPGNPIVLLYLYAYILRCLIGALSLGRLKPSFIPAIPNWSKKERRRIVGDLVVIGLLQCGLFLLLGGDWMAWAVVAMTAYVATSAVSMGYIFTNHFLRPIVDESDPVRSTTSVAVPRWIDWLHFNFSYHTEHHLFPSLNSRYYHLVSPMLAEVFPESYQRIPIAEAWRRLWKNPAFMPDLDAKPSGCTPVAKAAPSYFAE